MPNIGEHYYCEWQGCKDAYSLKPALRHALLTHMRYHINIAHRNLPEMISSERQTPIPTCSLASPSPTATRGANNFLGLLVDLLKKLAVFPSFVPAFLPHHSTLLFLATNVPLLSRDLFHILDLVSRQDEPEEPDESSMSPELIDLME
ncbi:hypothetical protein DSO57_1010103 [Entomophthora muscae]|uniref:Uncharacterized protein n=1 Tax=Entomophthora muscae TaxID=34485 RepID=A0ACC2U4E9_9FUNG|nr:hypothetical protein DSO57_1010103 [Entomophthora muscae]